MTEKTVRVPNINCGHCTATIEREVRELEGVESVKADLSTKMVTIRWAPPADWLDIESLLDEIGYPAEA